MVKSWLVSLYKRGLRRKRYIFFLFVFIMLFVLFTTQVKAFIVISLLGVIATFSTYYKRVFQAPPVFELMTLTTVAVSIFYGPIIGSMYTLVVSLTSEIMASAIDPFSATYIPPRMATAFAAPWLYANGMDLALLGLLMSALYNLLQQPVYWLLTDPEKRIKSIYFSSLNIPLNFLIFKFLGMPLFVILKAIV
ncbi:hypothetical protein HYU16_03135 [Candidatus Woesearchaeota archaeon]|nr:hypothetical protein [Candidatus Woesearchaeota archaeon]